ncbi:MAG: response regulator [Planctomycetota bacterium]|nr:response regulator [Planctomycetota bacterium]
MHLNALVINGAEIQRAGFIKMLQDARLADFSFTEARTLGDALTKIDPLKTDVIFIEWEMSVAVGLDFIRKVRQKQRRHIHIVAISTEGDMVKLEQMPDASSADYFVLRPFTAKTLEQKLSSLTAKLSAASKAAEGKGGAF